MNRKYHSRIVVNNLVKEILSSKYELRQNLPDDNPILLETFNEFYEDNTISNRTEPTANVVEICSIYNKLTRKCHCYKDNEYNDLVIHFNEETKHYTNDIGEIIKNMRILKKFLFFGGSYAHNALMFLDKGLTDSSPKEKTEIVQGIVYADLCSVFDDRTIVTKYVTRLSENETNNKIRTLTISVLYKLAETKEGQQYLNFNSKITNAIKNVLKKMESKLHLNETESLKRTLKILHPELSEDEIQSLCAVSFQPAVESNPTVKPVNGNNLVGKPNDKNNSVKSDNENKAISKPDHETYGNEPMVLPNYVNDSILKHYANNENDIIVEPDYINNLMMKSVRGKNLIIYGNKIKKISGSNNKAQCQNTHKHDIILVPNEVVYKKRKRSKINPVYTD